MSTDRVLTFGEFRLDPVSGHLYRKNERIPLAPKAFALLQFLAGQAGRLVSKQELLDAVWPGVFVGDAVLKGTIRELRKALGDDSHEPRFIETAHRRGYRFIAHVTVIDATDDGHRGRAARQLRAQRQRQHRLSGGRLRPDRSRLRDGLGVAPRILLERAVVCARS